MSKTNPKARIKLRSVRPPSDLKTIIKLFVGGFLVLAIALTIFLLEPHVEDPNELPTTLGKVMDVALVLSAVAAFFAGSAIILAIVKLINLLRYQRSTSKTKRSQKPSQSRKKKKKK